MSNKLSDFARRINTIIASDIISRQRSEEAYAKRVEKENDPENIAHAEGRAVLKEFYRLEKKHQKELEDTTSQQCHIMGNLILKQTKLIFPEEKYSVTFEDIKKVMNRHRSILDVLKQKSDHVLGQKKYGYYETMFQNLIKEDVRFSAFAPNQLFDNLTLKINQTRLCALSPEDFLSMIETMADTIKDSEGFKKTYLHAFVVAKNHFTYGDDLSID